MPRFLVRPVAPGSTVPGRRVPLLTRVLLGFSLIAAAPSSGLAQRALQLNGSNQYVTFGAATSSLGTSAFTIEVRFKRTGAGVPVSTGTGGVTAVPLVTKGRGEAENSNVDMNYFLGIDGTGHLVADYEEGAGQTSPGLNHPVTGSTVILNDVWYHAAARFDGTALRVYLNGSLDGETLVGAGRLPRYDSIQHAALGSALNSTGVAAGFFQGVLDEARIWNFARSQTDIQAGQNVEIPVAPGLLGRWGLNEGSGATAGNSVASSPNGALTGGPTWSLDSTVPLLTATGLRFGGTNSYVTFGDAAALHLPQFTLECWFRRDGSGTSVSTGTGGVTAVPLLAKGTSQADGSNLDMNYFLGIRSADSVLVADFEEGAGGASPGLNHPVVGSTPLLRNLWYHAAATYDGSRWRLYLNGNLEAELLVGQPVQSESIQHAGLATSLTSTGTAQGFFNGALDEARIWSTARSQSEIQSTINAELTGPTASLVARWGLNEDSGLTVGNSAGSPIDGTIAGTGWGWTGGSPFNAVPPTPPADPTGLTAAAASTSRIDLSWTDNAVDETGYEIERSTAGIGGPFTPLVSLGAGATGYSDTGLSPSTEYCYRVRAVNANGASGYAGPACAVTQAPPAPAAPSDLAASAPTYGQVHLTWADNSGDETGFEVERSTTGAGGPFTLLAPTGANTTGYDDYNREPSTEYCYRVRAVNGALASDYAAPACVTTPAAASLALDLGPGGNAYARFGDAPTLRLGQFTIEMWVRRDGAGVGTNTGSGGIPDLIPLVAKGRAEAEAAAVDINYIFGIKASNGVLCADFEEGPGGASPSLNHPITGTTAVATGAWHHVAVTYDGSVWKLYLDGTEDASLAVGQPPASASGVAVALGTALNSTGVAAGFFDGAIDEVRIWSYARSQDEIRSTANLALTAAQPALAARWSLDEGTGAVVNGSAGTAIAGALSGSPYSWTAGAPFNLPFTPPAAPSGLAAAPVTSSRIDLTWIDASNNESGFEVERSTSGSGGPFSPLATVAAGSTGYSDTGLNAATEYCYRLRAVNASGASSYDGPACATTLAPAYTLSVAVQPAGSGSVSRNPDQASYSPGSVVELTALPGVGYHFVGWAGDLTGSANPSTLTLDADKTVTAAFAIDTLVITASAGPGGSISPAGAVPVEYGADATFTVTPEPGFQVGDVLVDGVSVGAVTVYTFTGVIAGHTIAASFGPSPDALSFDGTNGYVGFGNPPELKLSAFTLEMWVRPAGPGVGTNTGTGGIPDLVPLLAKGRAEVEDPLKDINYIFGLRASTGTLAADFEEAAAPSPNPSLNHPVQGVTPLLPGTWYHVAATYDGATWRLYLNGAVDAELAVGRAPASASGVSVALASALNSTGVASGFFDGAIDEVRVWSAARSQAELIGAMNERLATPAAGLVARWGLDEGSGPLVHSTAGTTLDGTAAGTGWTWTAGAPFNAVPPQPPAAPSGLQATATTQSRVSLSWTDNANSETGFEIERSTSGSGGPYTLLGTAAANQTAYADSGLDASTEYCYRVRAVSGVGASGYDGPACATTPAAPASALSFGGGTYVTFGDPNALDLAQFTVECWFRRDAAGTTVSTGSGGVTDAIPLVTHGTSQSDGSNVDMNFFLGIRNSDGVLCADFEEGSGGATPGLNHPVTGTTPITLGTWYHAAATYDGATWHLYLNGYPEAALAVGQPVQSGSIQHAGLATSLTSTGTAQGFFVGALDEVRVWNVARTPAEIQSTANAAISAPQPSLVARWSLDEGAGTAVNGSAGTAVNGTIVGGSYAWAAPAPFNLAFTPPDPPSGLVATAMTNARIDLAWADNSNNEAGFEIERSDAGSGGPFSLIATAAANATAYSDAGLGAGTAHCYRVRAVNPSGSSSYDGPACATTPMASNLALDFAGNAYASFGSPASLQLSTFTIEMWLRRDGAGVGTNTGNGGVPDAIPLLAKGRAESETATTDINYLLGIRASDGVLCADFEEGQGGSSPSLNHPVSGTTPIPAGAGVWHHVAATYDGGTWKLYLDGALEASLDPGQPVAAASTVAVSLGSALTSTGAAAGFFDGALDEVRVWNYARTQEEIQSTANVQITVPTTGLVARWGLDEGSGTVVAASAGTSVNGSLTGSAFSWGPGAPFNLFFNQQPSAASLMAPADHAVNVSTSPTLRIQPSDPDGGTLSVALYGRAASGTAGPDFTIVGLPDTQYYTSELNGGTNAIFQSQTSWVAANREPRDIVYAVQLGDCTEHGDNGGNDIEWQRADLSLGILENPTTTQLPDGVPYGVCVGNHDQSPIGDADGTTTFYNQYFGFGRFTGRGYYGGHYGSNNNNWYDLFSASGMDFIVISLEYDTSPNPAVFAWANDLLTTYASRRAIVVSHFIINTGNPGSFGPQGQAIYDALKGHPNLFLMLCGHVPGEGRRQDSFNGNTVHTLLSDYQSRTNGGNGWLRIMEFSPANNVIRVRTYSPWLDLYEADADSSSQFTLPYNMNSTVPFALLATLPAVASGAAVEASWPGLSPNTEYEWYATVSDGVAITEGPVWRFTTGNGVTHTITASAGPGGSISPSGSVSVSEGSDQVFTVAPDAGYSVADVQVDGISVGAPTRYTFTGVMTDHTIEAAFTVMTAADVAPVTEFGFRILSANPSRARARVSLALPSSAPVELSIYDVTGRRVASLAEGRLPAGRHILTWSGRGPGGEAPSGVYFIRLVSPGHAIKRRFVLIR